MTTSLTKSALRLQGAAEREIASWHEVALGILSTLSTRATDSEIEDTLMLLNDFAFSSLLEVLNELSHEGFAYKPFFIGPGVPDSELPKIAERTQRVFELANQAKLLRERRRVAGSESSKPQPEDG